MSIPLFLLCFIVSLSMSRWSVVALPFFPPAFDLPVNLNLSPADVMVSEVKFLAGDLTMSLTREQDEGISGVVSVNELVDGDGQVAAAERGSVPCWARAAKTAMGERTRWSSNSTYSC